MEVRPGYKQTEVGVIPEDWEVVPIGDCASIAVGRDLNPESFSDFQDDTFKYPVFSNTVSNEGLYGYYSHYEYNGDSLTIVGRGVGLGTAFKRSGGYGAIGRLLVLFPEKNVAADFLTEYINHRVRIFTESGGIPQLTGISISKYKIPLPPTKTEQEAIAGALSDADALIESLVQLIAKKSRIKQSAIQELLTGKKRLPGFSGEWEKKALLNVAPLQRGFDLPTSKLKIGPYPVAYSNGVLNFHSTAMVKGPGVFTGRSGTIGRVNYIEADYWPHNTTLWVTDFKGNFPKFVYYLYSYICFERFGTGSGVPTLNRSDVHTFSIVLPLPPEQQAIAAILSDMDAEIAVLETKLIKARHLKQGMMQELLTGRIRLIRPASNVIPLTAKKESAAATATKSHNWQINETVVIAVLVKTFGTEKWPLSRKRYTKLSYLLHRHVEHKAEGYLKKAAGPYNPSTRYKGPEAIAQKNGYVRSHRNGNLEGFVAADNIAKAEAYFQQWYGPNVLAWLERFRFKKNDELELLATVDVAMEDLRREGKAVELGAVKQVIHDHPEWEAKLQREIFSDDNLVGAIQTCRELFE